MIQLYDKTGTAKLSVLITDKSVFHRGIMEEEYITLHFLYDEVISLANGDYIDSEYGRMEIVKLSTPDDRNGGDGGYYYEQRFNPRWWRGINHKLFYNRQAGAEASWKMTHYAYYFMDIVVDNMQRAGIGEYSYEIDASLTEMKLVVFDGVDIITGLNLIAEAFETEWWITDNVIHLGRCEYGDPILLTQDVEVGLMEREESSDTDYATRIFVFGAARNLPQNYRRDETTDLVVEGVVETRLKLPEGIDHIDAWDNLAEEDVVEGIVVADEVFPRRTGIIDTVSTKQYTDTTENEDGSTTETKWNAFRFTDSGIHFSEKYILEDSELRIIFQSGKLAGKDFAVTFNPDGLNETDEGAQVWEVVRNNNYGVNLPTDDFAPEPNDTYILYGYDTSFIAVNMVGDAEQELLEYGKKQVQKLSQDKSNYNCIMNPVRCSGYTEDVDGVMRYNESDVVDLDIGAVVELVHPVYFPTGAHRSRVRSVEKYLDDRFRCTYSVGESKDYSRSGELADKVEALTYQSKQYLLSAGAGVYLIKRQDSTAPSEHNAYSSIRARIEFMCRSVAEYVRTRWTFLKGLTIGTFSPGKAGAKIDADGTAEFADVTARGNASVGGDSTVKGMSTVEGDSFARGFLTSKNFIAGLLGQGGAMYKDEQGRACIDIDKLTVRQVMSVLELVIQKAKIVGGMLVVSRASGKIVEVGDEFGGSLYKCYLDDSGDGDFSWSESAKDMVRCARWDKATQKKVDYWEAIDGAGVENDRRYVILHKTTDYIPSVGDQLVQMGNTGDTSRQGFIVISVEDGHPRVDEYDGVNSASLDGKLQGRFGDLTGITHNGKALSGFGIWTAHLYGTADLVIDGAPMEEYITNTITANQASGANLLVGTNQGTNSWVAYYDGGGVAKSFIKERADYMGQQGVQFYVGDADYVTGGWLNYRYPIDATRIKKGKNYAVSVDVFNPSVESCFLHCSIRREADNHQLTDVPYTEITPGWNHATFVLSAIDESAESGYNIAFTPKDSNWGYVLLDDIVFVNLMMAEGSIPTVWSPAPEDSTDPRISALKTIIDSQFEVMNGSFTSLQSQVTTNTEAINDIDQFATDLDGKFNGLDEQLNGENGLEARVTTNTSLIEQNAEAITQTVTEVKEYTDGSVDAMYSQIKQEADNIALVVRSDNSMGLQLGVNNLLLDTAVFNAGNWSASDQLLGTMNAQIYPYDKWGDYHTESAFFYRDVSQLTSSSTWCFWAYKLRPEKIEAGKRYALSFWIRAAFPGFTSSSRVRVRAILMETNSQNPLTPFVDAYDYPLESTVGRKVTITFTATASGAEGGNQRVYIDLMSEADTNNAPLVRRYLQSVAFADMMLQEIDDDGTILDYSPSAEDYPNTLEETGIFLNERKIRLKSDTVEVVNNSGETTALLNEYGVLNTKIIQANELNAVGESGNYTVSVNRNGDGLIKTYHKENGRVMLQIGYHEIVDALDISYPLAISCFDPSGLFVWGLSYERSNNPLLTYNDINLQFLWQVMFLVNPDVYAESTDALKTDMTLSQITAYQFISEDEEYSAYNGIVYKTSDLIDLSDTDNWLQGTYYYPQVSVIWSRTVMGQKVCETPHYTRLGVSYSIRLTADGVSTQTASPITLEWDGAERCYFDSSLT